eukprot:2687327-Pleurochrysis_carterae.AAC.1
MRYENIAAAWTMLDGFFAPNPSAASTDAVCCVDESDQPCPRKQSSRCRQHCSLLRYRAQCACLETLLPKHRRRIIHFKAFTFLPTAIREPRFHTVVRSLIWPPLMLVALFQTSGKLRRWGSDAYGKNDGLSRGC